MYRNRRNTFISRLKIWSAKAFLFFIASIFIVWITSGVRAETIKTPAVKNKTLSPVSKKIDSVQEHTKRKNIFFRVNSNKNNPLKDGKRKADSFYLFSKMFIALSFILLLILLISFIFKKVLSKRVFLNNHSKENNLFSIVLTHNISPNKSILLSKFFDEYIIIGVTNNNINLISKVEPSEAFLLQQDVSTDTLNFADFLMKNKQGSLGNKKNKKSEVNIRTAVKNKLQNFKEL